ncbi:MAG: nuclear transport factor 2 family protein, partial [Gemmatimonadaceae bacterium]
MLRLSVSPTAIWRWAGRLWFTTAVFGIPLFASACQGARSVSATQRLAIADSLEALVKQAYDFSQPNPTQRLLGLYPDSGRVISAAAGRVTTTRAVLATEITGFWQRVGQNMKDPKFLIGSSYVDVLTPDAAVMTFSYSIPHVTPAGRPHTVAGAWTTLWRREGGRWMIVQEHLSDTPESTMSSGMAADTMSASDPSMHSMPGHVMPP